MKIAKFREIRGLNDVVKQRRQLKKVVSELHSRVSEGEEFDKFMAYYKGVCYLGSFGEQVRRSCLHRFVWEMVSYDYLEKIKRGDYDGARRFA